MNCQYCGAEMTRRDFCLNCGTRWEEPRAMEPVPELPPAALPEITEEELAAEFPTDFSLDLSGEGCALILPVERRLWKMVLFGILTVGIYPAVIWSRMVTELNITASRYDGKRTMPYFAMALLLPLTLGSFPLVWMHKFCRRVGKELRRRGGEQRFGPRDFWLWNVLGALILVGPFIFTHRLVKAMNTINSDFNIRG